MIKLMSAIGFVSLVAISGCKTTTSPKTLVVATNPELSMNPTIAAAIFNGAPFVYSSGVAELGTTSSTTLTFTNAGAGLSISSGGLTATAVLTFGSCIVTIQSSTYPAAHPMSTGKVVILNPCFVGANIAGANADASEALRNVYLQLGQSKSGLNAMPIKVEPDGTLNIYGRVVGKATVVISGATN